MFTDKVTIYQKNVDDTWTRTVVDGVQWADRYDKENSGGKITVAKYATVTFPEGTYEGLDLFPGEEDAIFYGEINEVITNTKGSRLSDCIAAHPRSGRIKSVNDNSNREMLKNIKVVVA